MHDTDNPSEPTHGATLVAGTDERPPTNAADLDTDRLVVLAFRDHEDWLDAVYSDPAGGPDALICAGDVLRSAAATVASEDDTGPTVVDISAVEDLGRIAVEVADAVDDCRLGGNNVALIVDGLDVALSAVAMDRVFRLVHVLRGHTQGGNDDLTVYLDPDALDEQTRLVLEPLFDRVLNDEEVPAERRKHIGR